MRVAACLVLTLAAAGCGGGHARSTPVKGPEWQAVVNDWLAHGRIAGAHGCAAAVVAETRILVEGPSYSRWPAAIARYARRAWAGRDDVWGVRVGMTDRQVAETAGAPVPSLSGPRCWVYKRVKPGTSIDSARYCFANGRVTTAQTAVHG